MRSASSALVLAAALAVGGAATARAEKGSVRLLVQSSPLAGLRYHEAASVWQDLRVGDALDLHREPGNPHDAHAISVSWRGRKLGYVPRRENAALSYGMDRGERPQARISRLSDHPNPARRIEMEVFLD